MSRIFRAAAPALIAVLLAGCLNPAMFRKGAFAIDDWDSWTGWNDERGRNEVRRNGLYYFLDERQDDTRDLPSDGYYPGLILSRDLFGQRWQADVELLFKIPPGAMKRFSLGVWVGGDYSRPSLGNASAAMKIIVQRQNGPRPEDDLMQLVVLPGGQPVSLPLKLKVLRFARDGDFFTVSYGMSRKKLIPVLRVDASAAADAPAQKFFLGGFSGGDPEGAYVRFKSMKVNDREVLR